MTEREQRLAEIEPLLQAAARAQENFHAALEALEEEVGSDLSIDNYDLQNYTAEDILEMAEAEEEETNDGNQDA